MDDYDLAGFSVGVVEKDALIDGKNVSPGDTLIGLRSSGPHSNGYSLIRKIIDVTNADLLEKFAGKTLGEVLMEPTRIYVKPLLTLLQSVKVHAMAHITGGGLLENLPRVLPDNCAAKIEKDSWTQPKIFQWIQENGNVDEEEMFRTFNCGIGMVLVVKDTDTSKTIQLLNEQGETAFKIGSITELQENDRVILI